MALSFGANPDQTPEQQARAALDDQLAAMSGRTSRSHIVENPKGNISVPTSFNELQQRGVPTDFEDLASRRFSMEGPDAQNPTAGLTFGGEDQPFDPRTQVGGMGTVLGMGVKQLGQGLVGLAELAGIDARPTADKITESLQNDFANLSPDVQKKLDAKWTSLDEDSVARNPSAILYQLVEQLPMTAVTMGIPVTRAAMVAQRVFSEAVAKGATESAARALGAEAAAKSAATTGAVSEGTLDVGFTKQGAVDSAKTTPLEDLMQVPVFKGKYEQLLKGTNPAMAEKLARDYLGKYAVDNVGNTESLTAGALTALAAAFGEGYLGKLVGGGVAGTRLGRAGKAAVVEGGTEALQNPSQQIAQNVATQAINPNQPTFEGAGEAAVQGAALGAVMGAPVGAIASSPHPPVAPAVAPPVAPPVPVVPPAPAVPPAPVSPAPTAPVGVPPTSTPPAPLPIAAQAPAPVESPVAAEAPAPAEELPPAPVTTEVAAPTPIVNAAPRLGALKTRDPDAQAFTDFRAKLAEIKTAAEAATGEGLPPVSARMGVAQVAKFMDALGAKLEATTPGVSALLQHAVEAPHFAAASGLLDTVRAAIGNKGIELGKVGTPEETLTSQIARARAQADQFAALPPVGKEGKPRGVTLSAWANAVGDFATALNGLLPAELSADYPANIRMTIAKAQALQAEAASPNSNVSGAQVRKAYTRLVTMAAQVEQLQGAPTPAAQPEAAAATAEAPAPAPTPEPAVTPTPVAPEAPPPAPVSAPVVTKGEAVKAKAKSKAATAKEQKAALNEQLVAAVKKSLEGKNTTAARHEALMQHPMYELQKMAAHLGVATGPSKGEKVRGLLARIYEEPGIKPAATTAPESLSEPPKSTVTGDQSEPNAASAPSESSAPPKKAVEIKLKAKRRAIRQATSLPDMVVEPRIQKQEGKTLAGMLGFESTEDIRQELGAKHPLLADFNKKDSAWAWVYGLRTALTDAQNKTLASLEKRYRESKTDDEALNAELTIRAWFANVEGKRVPSAVQEHYMQLAKMGREIAAQAELEEDADAESIDTLPGNVEMDEDLAGLTPQNEDELRSLIAQQEADDTHEIEQELGFGQSIYDTDENDYENQQSSHTYGGPGNNELFRSSQKFVERLNSGYDKRGFSFLMTYDILPTWIESLPKNATILPLLEALRALNLDVTVQFSDEDVTAAGEYRGGRWYRTHPETNAPQTEFNFDDRVITVYTKHVPDAHIPYVLLHEMVHAATIYGYLTNDELRARMDELYFIATDHWKKERDAGRTEAWEEPYGLTNVHEFMAEALASPEFQRFLSKIPAPKSYVGKAKSALDAFILRIKNFLGVGGQSTLLEQVILTTEQAFRSEEYLYSKLQGTTRQGHLVPSQFLVKKQQQRDLLTLSNPKNQQRLNTSLTNTARVKSKVMEKLKQANLGFMDGDFMERKYRGLMDKLAAASGTGMENPLQQFFSAVQKAEAYARDLGQKAGPIVERFMALPEAVRTALFQMQLDSTLAEVHVDLPLTHPANAHLLNKKGTLKPKYANAPQLIARFNRLSPESKVLYTGMKDMLQEAYTRKRSAVLEHIAKRYGLSSVETAALKAVTTPAELIAFGNQFAAANPNVSELLPTAEGVVNQTQIKGPYFPLRREGDYVVHTIDGGAKIVSFFPTLHDANEAAAQMKATGRDVEVTRKISQDLLTKDVQNVVRDLSAKIRDKDVKSRVQDAMVSLLADNILYGSQLKRKKIAGVDPKKMGKAFEDYVRASMGFIGNIETAFDVDAAMKNLNELQSGMAGQLRGQGVTPDELIEVGFVNDELKLRNQELAADRNQGNVEQIIGTVGFLNYLGAPSYWLLNATQTAVVSTPFLAGRMRVSYVRAAMALKNAYGVLRRATKGKGWKGMMDLDAIVNALSPAQRTIINQLIADNIIGSTIAYEFGNLVNKHNVPIYSKTMKILELVPEMVERFNRISTALAAIELGGGYQEAKDAVQATQFNYSPQNRARLLKYAPKWLGGGGRPFIQAMMMFKVFGVNMTRLIYGNMYDALRGETPAKRTEARRIMAGLLMSHSLFGGVYGGLGLGAAQIVGGAINALFKPEDKVDWAYEVNQFLTQHTNEYVARIITRGAPASVGIDLSNSINTGNLLFMLKDTNLSEPGGAETALATLMGPVAQYGIGAVREMAKFADGESNPARVLQKAVPLKLMSSLARTYDQGFKGLQTANGQTFMQPGEINFVDDLIGAVGLKSARVSQRQDVFYTERGHERTLEDRKSQLMGQYTTASGADQYRARRAISVWNQEMVARGNRQLVITPSSLKESAGGRNKTAKRFANQQFTEYR